MIHLTKIHNSRNSYISQLLIVSLYKLQVTSDNLLSYIYLSLHNALFMLKKWLRQRVLPENTRNNTRIGSIVTQKVMISS